MSHGKFTPAEIEKLNVPIDYSKYTLEKLLEIQYKTMEVSAEIMKRLAAASETPIELAKKTEKANTNARKAAREAARPTRDAKSKARKAARNAAKASGTRESSRSASPHEGGRRRRTVRRR